LYGGDWPAICDTASRALQVVRNHPSPIGRVVLANAALVEAFLPTGGDYSDRIDALLRSLERTDLGVYGANAALALGVCAVWQRKDVKRASSSSGAWQRCEGRLPPHARTSQTPAATLIGPGRHAFGRWSISTTPSSRGHWATSRRGVRSCSKRASSLTC
jgi:hypothetical protein